MGYSKDEVSAMKAAAVPHKARASTKYIVIHCADTPPKMDIGVAEIRQWHLKNGWSDIGYHFVIRRTGRLERGRPLDAVGSHVKGYNAISVGVCLVGGRQAKSGKPENNFTNEQWHQLYWVVSKLVEEYPDAKVVSHHDLDKGKACPSFDAQTWWLMNHWQHVSPSKNAFRYA